MIEVREDGQAVIKNLSSRNTTQVNGFPVDVRVLNNGDRVEFGIGQTVAFTFSQDQTVAVNNPLINPYVSSSSLPLQPLSGDQTVFWNQPQKATSVFQVQTTSRLRVGRAPDNDIVLDAPGVSRYHAHLEYTQGDQPVLTDLGSTNGTFVNGEILRSARILQPTDWVSIGGFLLRVQGREVKNKTSARAASPRLMFQNLRRQNRFAGCFGCALPARIRRFDGRVGLRKINSDGCAQRNASRDERTGFYQ